MWFITLATECRASGIKLQIFRSYKSIDLSHRNAFQTFMEFPLGICSLGTKNTYDPLCVMVFFFLLLVSFSSPFRWNEIWNRDPNRVKEKNEIPMVAAIAPVLHLSHTFQTFRLHFNERPEERENTHNTRISSHVLAIYGWCRLLQRRWRWVNSMFKKKKKTQKIKNRRRSKKLKKQNETQKQKREW